MQRRQGAGDRPAGGHRLRVGALAAAVRGHDAGAPPAPPAVDAEHPRGDLALERRPAVGAAEPAGRPAAPHRPRPEPARRPGLAVVVLRAGVQERTAHQCRAQIGQGLRVGQTPRAQQGALRGTAAQRGAGVAVHPAPPDRRRGPVRHGHGHPRTGPPHARPGAAGRGQQPRRGHLGPHRVTPVGCRVPRGLATEPGPSQPGRGLRPAEGQGLCCNFRAATSGWTTFGKHRTGSPIMPSDNPFKWRQFEPALILQCVRWYLRYALSYRDLEDMMRERGLCVDHTTIYRWVQRYAPEIDKRCRPFLRRTNDSYRIDETYVRVAGAWTYLYRGVDSNGDTLDFLLRATRDRKAAIAFFRKTLGAAHTTPPRVVTVDKNPAYPVAFEAVRHEGLVRPRSNLRQCKYLNNIIEQDHRFIKRRTRPMLGFKRFTTAWRTLRGIEIMHALRKGQARWMAKGDVVGQTQLIHKVFGLAA